jgi:hypothetical protein
VQVPTCHRCKGSTWEPWKKKNHQISERNTHSLKLVAPSSPIASDGEESLKIESFEEKIARFDEETLVQQWYDDVSFSGFGFDYGGMLGASSSHPPPFDSPPPANPQNVVESEDNDDEWKLLIRFEVSQVTTF